MSDDIPAGELGRRCADSISPDLFQPLVRRLADDVYERLLDSVQDYLVDNSEWNIAERIAVAEGEAKRLREELNEIDKALGFDTWRGTRAERIAELHGRLNAALSTGAKA